MIKNLWLKMIHNIQSIPILQETIPFKFNLLDLNNIEFTFKPNNNNYFSNNTQILDLPNLINLKLLIEQKLKDFQKKILGIEQELYITESWITKTLKDGSHTIHNHPNSMFSGIFYIQVPDKSFLNFHFENNLFQWFNFTFNYSDFNEFNSKNLSVSVKENDFIIFPSWLEHSVDINSSTTERIILGFNTFVKGTFGNNKYPTRLIL